MTAVISSNVWKTLRCSFCGSELKETPAGAQCLGCGLEYPDTPGHSLDLRLKKPKQCDFAFELGTPLKPEIPIEPLTAKSDPEVDFGGMSVPFHMTRELMSYFPRARSPGSLMLDLGCGDAVHRQLCERAGYEWVGIDYADSSRASILADAHALPFQDDTFECILTVAVFHLIRFPFVAMREAYRVLKPHGILLGTVAFLEPFHPQTYYNHSHLGTFNTLRSGGFTVEKLAPSEEWTGLAAQASMGLFPRMPRFMTRSICCTGSGGRWEVRCWATRARATRSGSGTTPARSRSWRPRAAPEAMRHFKPRGAPQWRASRSAVKAMACARGTRVPSFSHSSPV